jgi:hypothetical protein
MLKKFVLCLGVFLLSAVMAAAQDASQDKPQDSNQDEQQAVIPDKPQDSNQDAQQVVNPDKKPDVKQENQKDAEQDESTGTKELSGMSIVGNEDAPKSLYIVPWKSAEIGAETSMDMMLNEGDTPVDRDVFKRQVEFYQVSTQK